jgi:hypothetical protein
MTGDQNTAPYNQVVVTANLESYLSPAIELAIAIARASKSGLHGLFVEDLDLLRLAGLPFANEVSLVSAQARVVDKQQVMRSFNARSRHFRRSIEQQAEKCSLPWSYSRARGGKIAIALEESVNAEFLVIGQSNGTLNSTRIPGPKRILLVDNNSQHLFDALDVVLDNFPGQFVELLLVPSLSNTSASTSSLIADKLKRHPHSRLIEISHESLPAIIQSPNLPVGCAITSRKRPELIHQIMPYLSCPAIVVS